MRAQAAVIAPQDIVLIHIDHKPAFFARIEDIIPDVKRGWWQVKLFILALPMKVVTWIIDDDQIRGADFTMNSIPIRIELVSPPPEEKPEESANDTPEPATQERKQARILSLNKKPVE